MQEWYLGWDEVSYLERCPQFIRVLIERERGSTVNTVVHTVRTTSIILHMCTFLLCRW